MAMQDPQAEPSMEEILASIRRIISEEEQAAPGEPVLDLTQTEEAAPSAEDDIVFEAMEEAPPAAPAAPAQPAKAAPVAAAASAPAAAPVVDAEAAADSIISPPTATAAAGALARLAGTLRISDTSNQTLEGVVRELLRPMLKEWLERNLPSIVEARVEAELERIARLAR